MPDPNLPSDVTDAQISAAGEVKRPTDEQILDYLRLNCSLCEILACDTGDATITEDDALDECCFVHIPVTVKVYYGDVDR